MELGQRLRQARLEKRLSQRQLCGDAITRNMLSQIENGSARPSMDTLSYLAARLGKPVSFFLEEESAAVPNLSIIQQARLHYARKEWSQLLSQLQQYQDGGLFDGERWLMQAVCLMELAAETENKAYAEKMLEEAAEAGKRTPYYTDEHERRRLLVLSEMTGTPQQLPGEDRALLLRASWMLKEGNYRQSQALLDSCTDQNSSRWHCLYGETAFALNDFQTAISHYLQAQGDYPVRCCEKLEQCYQAVGDYKMAYEYACKRREQT